MRIALSEPCIKGNELKYVTEAVETGWVSTAGSFVNRLEEDIAKYVGAKHAVASTSGTAALHLALIAFGVGPSDEVLVPDITFIAPVNTIRYVGADPVFMDCDDYLNIDPVKIQDFCTKECDFDGSKLINKITKKCVKAIIPVHIFGHPVNMEPIMEIAEKFKIFVIEDATESLGSKYTKGRFAGKATGTIGHIGCFSFNGNKIITTGGGGMAVTDNPEWARHMKYLSNQAKDDDAFYIHNEVGFNYRMTNVEAALGVAQLERLDEFISIKRKNFALYHELLGGVEGLSFIEEPDFGFSNYWFYSLVVNKDEARVSNIQIMEALKKEGIQTRPIWRLNHEQKPYIGSLAYNIERAYRLHNMVLNLPCSVGLREEEIRFVAEKIKECIRSN